MSFLDDAGDVLGGAADFLGGSKQDKSAPLSLVFKSARGPSLSIGPLSIGLPSPPVLAVGIIDLLTGGTSLKTFDSYSFERNLLSPATPFRFTAPGVDKDLRMKIRSGDTVQIFVTGKNGKKIPIATGFIDETDTHISTGRVEYVLTGRDTLGQLVDNAAVDSKNKIQYLKNASLKTIFERLIDNTRIPQQYETQNVPNGSLLFQTNVGETKMNALQRYLELTNCLVWTKPNGQIILGAPKFNQTSKGTLSVGLNEESIVDKATSFIPGSNQKATNVLDCRVRRNLNHAVRQVVSQLQNLSTVDADFYTIANNDEDMQEVALAGVGRSVYNVFSFGEGANAVNFLFKIPKIPGMPNQIGAAISLREIARENVNVLDVEMKVQGHLNSNGVPYDVDQIYTCNIPDEDIEDDLYCYAVTYELTLEHGMMTTLRLCKLGTIVAGASQLIPTSFF